MSYEHVYFYSKPAGGYVTLALSKITLNCTLDLEDFALCHFDS